VPVHERTPHNAMKALFFPFSLMLVSQAQAQPQWRFHLAFEDAIGAKDTLWFLYDTTATLGGGWTPIWERTGWT